MQPFNYTSQDANLAPTEAERRDGPAYLEAICFNKSGTAISAGDSVKFEAAVVPLGRCVTKSAAALDEPICGVAKEDIPDGDQGLVRFKGIILNARVTVGVAAGELLTADDALSGGLKTGVAGTNHIVAYALQAAVALKADVWVL